MTDGEMRLMVYGKARSRLRDGDLLLFRRRGLISIAGRGDHTHAAKAAWWGDDLLFLQGFNTCMLEHDRPIWAVAVPVVVRYEADAQVGASVRGFAFADPPPAAAAP
jgi:hypothetical protein